MSELKKYTVFGNDGRLGVLTAPARFLDPRTEKTIALDSGGEMSVPSDKLEVQPDGSFYLHDSIAKVQGNLQESAASAHKDNPGSVESPPDQTPIPASDRSMLADKLFRDGYTIERVKVDRLVKDPVSQRQEGDTLILPVLEEVYVVEKRVMLREEIRITRVRDEVKGAKPLEIS